MRRGRTQPAGPKHPSTRRAAADRLCPRPSLLHDDPSDLRKSHLCRVFERPARAWGGKTNTPNGPKQTKKKKKNNGDPLNIFFPCKGNRGILPGGGFFPPPVSTDISSGVTAKKSRDVRSLFAELFQQRVEALACPSSSFFFYAPRGVTHLSRETKHSASGPCPLLRPRSANASAAFLLPAGRAYRVLLTRVRSSGFSAGWCRSPGRFRWRKGAPPGAPPPPPPPPTKPTTKSRRSTSLRDLAASPSSSPLDWDCNVLVPETRLPWGKIRLFHLFRSPPCPLVFCTPGLPPYRPPPPVHRPRDVVVPPVLRPLASPWAADLSFPSNFPPPQTGACPCEKVRVRPRRRRTPRPCAGVAKRVA